MKQLLYDPVAIGLTVGRSMGVEVFVTCPFHNDSRPSAEFNRQTGLFYCFSCSARSNAKILAKKLGGTLEREWVDKPRNASEDIDWRPLLNAPLAFGNEYLEDRGVWDTQVEAYGIRAFEKGIVFPITNTSGTVVGVVIRQFRGTPKYLVLGDKQPLWPMHLVPEFRPGASIALTEGVFGFLAAERARVPALASLSCMVKENAGPWLRNLNPLVCFDDDDAGYIGASRVLRFAPLSRVAVPGREFDEMTPAQWREFWNNGATTTRSLTELASYVVDKAKFWSRIPKSLNRQNKSKQVQIGRWRQA